MTDTLSPFINDNDKTPIWDSTVLIYNNNDTKRKNDNIIGKVDVQVKGRSSSDLKVKECSYSVKKSQLIAYKNGGGAIFFLVLISKDDPTYRKVFYETLTPPLKIRDYLKIQEKNGPKTIKLRELPSDQYEIQAFFYNFYQDCDKQHSFKDIPPISLEELSIRTDITEITATTTTYLPPGSKPKVDAFLTNEVCFYAKIQGSPILHPIELPEGQVEIEEENPISAFIDGEKYYDHCKVIHSKEKTVIRFGENTSIIINKNNKEVILTYTSTKVLKNRIRDLKFLIHTTESKTIHLDNNEIIRLGDSISGFLDIDQARKDLHQYMKIQDFLDFMSIKDGLNLDEINKNSSWKELNLLVDSINGQKRVTINSEIEIFGNSKEIARLPLKR